jgi:hypothetical protein
MWEKSFYLLTAFLAGWMVNVGIDLTYSYIAGCTP